MKFIKFNKEKIINKINHILLKIKYFIKESLLKLNDFFNNLNWKLFWFTTVIIIIISLILANIAYLLWVKKFDFVKVPSLEKKFLVEAILELQKYDLYPKIESIYSVESYGYVISQDPQPGKIIRNKRFVRLLVSVGPYVKTLEDFTGKSIFYAEKKLNEISSITKKNIVIKEINYQFSDTVEKGFIVSQQPAPGTDLILVNEVILTVSKGPVNNDIAIPSFIGLTIDQATLKAKENGIFLKIEYIQTENPEEFDVVIQQSISPGEIIKPNTELTIYVGKRKE
ncbi:MAG: PASTA domain-containing protein [Spirochaetes bacterium]|nr:PASTA domain-containing protein [Spirochaetota bacterium]